MLYSLVILLHFFYLQNTDSETQVYTELAIAASDRLIIPLNSGFTKIIILGIVVPQFPFFLRKKFQQCGFS